MKHSKAKKKPMIQIDERNRETIRNISSVLYIVNLYGMIAVILYKQFWLKQDSSQFEDLSIFMTLNVIVFLSSIFFLGGITFRQFSPIQLVVAYLVLFVAGVLFIILKYGWSDWDLLIGKVGIVACILAILVSGWYFLAWLGNRRLERD